MTHATDRTIARLAAPQFGNFTKAQARAAGLTSRELSAGTRSGRLERPFGSLYRVAGAPRSWRGDLLAACWAGGPKGVASHRSAAELWRFAGGTTDFVEITCPRWRRAKYEGLVVHESKVLSPSYITEIDGIPVTTPGLTLLMMGAVATPLTVEKGLDKAIRLGLVTDESMRTLVRRIGRRGRDGSGVLRSILRQRDPDRAPCESEMETELFALLRRYDLPLPIPQYEIFAKGRFVARADFAYVEARLAIEYQSYQEHAGNVAHERDATRRGALQDVDWTQIDVTFVQIRERGSELCNRIRRKLQAASLL